MVKVVILLADGFEEIEAVTTIDLLRRAGVTVEIIAIPGKSAIITGARSISVCSTGSLDELSDEKDADAVIIPGGMPGSKALAKEAKVGEFLKLMNNSGKLICSICASPAVVLSPLGLLSGKKFTCYPDMENDIPQFAGSNWKDLTKNSTHLSDLVVVDGNLITSRGPGTTSAFAFTIIEKLCGKEVAQKVKQGTLFA